MTRKTQLVFVPTPWISHLVSTVELAKLLVDRHSDISVVILIINLPFDSEVSGYVDRNSRNLSSITFHLLPTPSNIPNCSSPTSYTIIIDLHKPFVKQVLESRVESGSTKPAGLVLDIFCTTMMDIGDDLNIPTYIYCPCGANYMSFMLHSLSLVDDHGIDISTQFSDPDKELGIAVEIRMDYRIEWRSRKENMLVTADEIENGVKKLMSMDKETKEKVKKMSKDGKKALQQGGSSGKDLDRFLANVLDNVIKQI